MTSFARAICQRTPEDSCVHGFVFYMQFKLHCRHAVSRKCHAIFQNELQSLWRAAAAFKHSLVGNRSHTHMQQHSNFGGPCGVCLGTPLGDLICHIWIPDWWRAGRVTRAEGSKTGRQESQRRASVERFCLHATCGRFLDIKGSGRASQRRTTIRWCCSRMARIDFLESKGWLLHDTSTCNR